MRPYYRQNKYGRKKVTVDGLVFDSKKEAKRYQELTALELSGEITDLHRQVTFILIPDQREPDTIGPKGGIKRGKVLERKCTYVADFVYKKDGEPVVEDTKGFKTKDYIIKRKLMLYMHNIRIHEI